MHGAGNDFVVVADPDSFFWKQGAGEVVRSVCAPHTGLTSEGLIALAPSGNDRSPIAPGEPSISMVFFNPDGSRASMCGNGARCAAFFAFRKGWAGREMQFLSDAGAIGACIVEGDRSGGLAVVRVEATEIRGRRTETGVAALPGRPVSFLDSGVPHAVAFFDTTEEEFAAMDIAALGRAVRFDKAFAPDGANADFVRVTGAASLALRTYERGVEAETGACGTGAIAAAVAAAERGLVKLPCSVSVRSGAVLSVEAAVGADGLCRAPSLTGPAQIVCEGRLDPGFFA